MVFNKKTILSVLLASLVIPSLAFAQPGEISAPLTTVVAGVLSVALNILWGIAIAVVIIMFTISGFKFMTAQGDSKGVGEARNAVIWGLVGTAVIVLAWSAIAIVRYQLLV